MQAEIYTKANCSYCVKAKSLLSNQNVVFKEYIISAGFDEDNPSEQRQYVTKEQLLERVPHAKTVPQIWLNGNYIGGYTELEAFFKA